MFPTPAAGASAPNTWVAIVTRWPRPCLAATRVRGEGYSQARSGGGGGGGGGDREASGPRVTWSD